MMKIPQTPPDLDDMVREITPEMLPLLAAQRFGLLADGKYLHWDALRHRDPPPGLSQKVWWFAVRMARSAGSHFLPLSDKAGQPFSYTMPEPLLRNLHEIDRSAGMAPGMNLPSALQEEQGRYLMSSLIDEAITSSQLEGASTTRRVAEAMLREGRRPTTLSERMIFNNFEAMRRIREICGETLTPERVIDLQRVLTEDTLEQPEDCGRLRQANDIEVVAPNNEHLVLHHPPDFAELPARLQSLCDFANMSPEKGDFVHPVVRGVLLHFMIGYDHPFADGNGRTGRALFYWYMAKQGYWLAEYLSISRLLKKAPVQYAYAYLHTETDAGDTTYFLLHQTEVILNSLETLYRYLSRKQREQADVQAQLHRLHISDKALNHRQAALLVHALKRPHEYFTIESHQRSHQIAYGTARSDLLGLTEKSLLVESRLAGRKRAYYPASDLKMRLQQKPDDV